MTVYTLRSISRGWNSALTSIILVTALCMGLTAPLPVAGTEQSDEAVPVPVSVDIRPGLCPNHLRLESPLTLPIAITGTVGFEIELIDPTSVRLVHQGFEDEIEPVRWAYADVGTPIVGGLCACHKLRGDGIDDLEFHFSIPDIVETFDLVENPAETLELALRGRLVTGEPFEGTDCAVLLRGPFENESSKDEICLLTCESEVTPTGDYRFAYHTSVSDRVTFAIYDPTGRMVALLNDMDMSPGIYTATWNGLGGDKKEAPPGIYFVRVSNSIASDTRKFTVP